MTIIFCLLLLSVTIPAQQVSAPHVTLDLVAENSSVIPGRDFSVGLLFNLEKGWHVYWINPGDSGDPPKVQWELPSEFQASEIEWPTPQRLPIPPLMDYGYENRVLLPIRIHPANDLKLGEIVKLAASVKWIVCREVCIPERGRLTLTLPVGVQAPKPSRNYDLFARTRLRIPKPAPSQMRLQAISLPEAFLLQGHVRQRLNNAQFFPSEPLQIENAAPQEFVSHKPQSFCLKLKKSEQLSKSISILKGVLVVGEKAYRISAPVISGKSAASRAHC